MYFWLWQYRSCIKKATYRKNNPPISYMVMVSIRRGTFEKCEAVPCNKNKADSFNSSQNVCAIMYQMYECMNHCEMTMNNEWYYRLFQSFMQSRSELVTSQKCVYISESRKNSFECSRQLWGLRRQTGWRTGTGLSVNKWLPKLARSKALYMTVWEWQGAKSRLCFL